MALTKQQHAARDSKIGASFIPALMAGDKDRILSEWKRLVGDPSWVEEDLSDAWPVQFGSFIEPFALDWFQKKSGKVLSRRGEWVSHPGLPHLGCTLDAYIKDTDTVVDCKAPGQWRKLDEVQRYYVPQMIVQRACVGCHGASLLIVHGGSEPIEYPCDIDAAYEKEVFERIAQFWNCVETLTPPFEMASALAPVVPEKTYDFSTDNSWCNQAGIWLENKDAAKKFDGAAKELKAVMPADGIKAFGGGIIIARNKAGSLSIKEGK